MRLAVLALALGFFVQPLISQDNSAGRLLESVRSLMHAGSKDSEIASAVRGAKLSQQLPEEYVEELQSEGAGPETLEELDRQRDLTRKLPPPAQNSKLFDAPPAPTAEQQAQVLGKARELALQYTASLPDFLCTEQIRRYSGSKQGNWKPTDTLKVDVAYSEKGERYRLLQINGQPTTRTLTQIGGMSSNGEFGSLLKWIFDPKSETDFHWEHWSDLRRRPTYVFSYRIDKAHSHYLMNWKTSSKKYSGVMGMRGLVYIDGETNQVMRFSDEADDIPSGWPVSRTPAVVDYDYADVGGKTFLLPRNVDVRVDAREGISRNVIEFVNYRKFAGEATVTFDK